jgi:hypothetical protein
MRRTLSLIFCAPYFFTSGKCPDINIYRGKSSQNGYGCLLDNILQLFLKSTFQLKYIYVLKRSVRYRLKILSLWIWWRAFQMKYGTKHYEIKSSVPGKLWKRLLYVLLLKYITNFLEENEKLTFRLYPPSSLFE